MVRFSREVKSQSGLELRAIELSLRGHMTTAICETGVQRNR